MSMPDDLDTQDLLAILDRLPVPIAVHGLGQDTAARLVNQNFTRTFGYTLSDAPTLDDWARQVYPDPAVRDRVLSAWWAEIAQRQATGKVIPPGEYRIFDKEGRPRQVLMGFALHGDLVIVTLQDLTATRAAEAALAVERRDREQTAFALTENMPAGAFTMVQPPGAPIAEFAFLSRQFRSMLGLPPNVTGGDPLTGFSRVHPDDLAQWAAITEAAFATGSPFSGETRIIVNEETRWVRAEAVPREREDGSIIWEGVLVDFTRLKQTEERLKTVIEASRALTWRFDLVRHRVQFDEYWAAAHGYAAGETETGFGHWLADMHPEDLPGFLEKLVALREGWVSRQSAEYRRRHRDGHWIWLQVHAGVSERDAEGKPTVLSGVSFDISDLVATRVRAQEAQAQLREDLQRAQQRDTVAQVAGGVAHDVNNLIAVVAGTAEMLDLRADGQPWLREGLGRIRRSVGMARDLVAGLGGLIRPDLPRAAQDLGKLLADSVELLGQRRMARHAIRLDLAERHPPVWANPTEMAQVIVNLAINACDSGVPDEPAKVTLRALPAGTAPPYRAPDAGIVPHADQPMAVFTVSDTGAGIADAVRARMFRQHFTTKGKAGTGLGLRIVSTILHANNAALWVDSTQGQGTTMTVAWPTVRAGSGGAGTSDRTDRSEPAPAVPPGQRLQGLRILVVDDLPDVADVLANMLEAAGAIAVAVSNPFEAAEALAEAPEVWAALVTDLHMPGLDGLALAHHAASLRPAVPTVLVTARPDMLGTVPEPLFSDVLPKPVTGPRLVRAVRKAADSRQSETG